MTTISHALTGKPRPKGLARPGKEIVAMIFSGETCWFTITLLLFLALGPFSVIAAVAGVCSLIPEEGEVREPEADG